MPTGASADPAEEIAFGPFRLAPARLQLLERGEPVRLGSRSLALLTVLLERPGEVVAREELVARVWPGTFVDDGNLRVHIAALRRALGDGRDGSRYIVNVPGRGYSFVAPLSRTSPALPPAPRPAVVNLPEPAARMVGRDHIVDGLVAQLPQRRFVSIVGAGGIGKTTVALAVAARLAAGYPDGAHFIDLAPVADPDLVPGAVAAALGLAIRSEDAVPDLLSFLRDRNALLLLDNCEHVVEVAACLAEDIVKAAPGIHLLVTSREPLRAEGERVHRLPPLELPPAGAPLTAAEALTAPAVQLFVERAAASSNAFVLSDADAPVAAEICRRLDGIALAIELAAGRVESLGLHGLAERLDDRFRILTNGRRTALPRHQTLAATVDWSYGLLPPAGRAVLRRLGVFAGSFTLPSAAAVAGPTAAGATEMADQIADLVSKSLVAMEGGGLPTRYRLLDSTRAYALGRLAEEGELAETQARHARHLLAVFQRAANDWEGMRAADWLAAHGHQLGNLRAALDWAFAPEGERELGIALTIAAIPLWFQLSLIDECRIRVERALAAVPADPDAEMRLQAALGWSLMYATVPGRETGAAWMRALELAERLGDADHRLRALWGLWASRINNGAFRAALALARRFRAVADEAAAPDAPVGDRMIGASLHFLGDQAGARRHIERALRRLVRPVSGAHVIRYQFDQIVTARITLARVQWLDGLPDQAMRTVSANIADAEATGHILSLCNALAQAACPIALLAGDLGAAERFGALLASHTGSHALDVWRAYAGGFRGAVLVGRGELEDGIALLEGTVSALGHAKFVQYFTMFQGLLAEALATAGRVADARAAASAAIARAACNEERWFEPELLRIDGEVARREGGEAAARRAEACFRQAAELAASKGALAWQLRAATSLARLLSAEGRRREAVAALSPVYARFTEGFDTADLRAARGVLDMPVVPFEAPPARQRAQ